VPVVFVNLIAYIMPGLREVLGGSVKVIVPDVDSVSEAEEGFIVTVTPLINA
jgi:hypothetical protein